MNTIQDEAKLQTFLKSVDSNIEKLNDKKIIAFFEFLGLIDREDVPKNFLDWETILVVVPNRNTLQQIKHYKTLIYGITFITNTNAKKIHIYDFIDWQNKTKNKTQFQIRQFLKTNFGGVEKSNDDRDWVKLL
ncbi:hypothetical protein [Flavobacterium sp.]|uniref:hypothetical protein n=1 Tax=Flavobacterium sp. TaxID=239 RepID=UPI003D0A3283